MQSGSRPVLGYFNILSWQAKYCIPMSHRNTHFRKKKKNYPQTALPFRCFDFCNVSLHLIVENIFAMFHCTHLGNLFIAGQRESAGHLLQFTTARLYFTLQPSSKVPRHRRHHHCHRHHHHD